MKSSENEEQFPPRIYAEFRTLSPLCISINLPYAHVWNPVVMFGLVPLVTTWNC